MKITRTDGGWVISGSKFRMKLGHLNNRSGEPIGFWFGWNPVDTGAGLYAPLKFDWEILIP